MCVCVCVCVRARERETHTHTFTMTQREVFPAAHLRGRGYLTGEVSKRGSRFVLFEELLAVKSRDGAESVCRNSTIKVE